MMIRWWEHSQKGVTDGQTDGQKIPFIELLMELHQSPGIYACFELGMDASKYAPFEVRNITIVHELWLTLHCIALLVSCWLESNYYSLSTPNRRAWVPPHWQNERKKFSGRLITETFVSFALRSLYHQNGSTYSSIKCSSVWCHDGYICQCLNSLLKRVLHVLRNTFRTVAAQFFCTASGPF